MAQNRARAFLRQKEMESYNDLMQQWEDLQTENVEAQDQAGYGRMAGMVAGAAIASIVGVPLLVGMAMVGAGSRLGSEAGEHWAGGFDFGGPGVQGAEGIKPTGMRQDLRRNLQGQATDAYGGWDTEQNLTAIQDFVSAYGYGGGGTDVKASFGQDFKLTKPSIYQQVKGTNVIQGNPIT